MRTIVSPVDAGLFQVYLIGSGLSFSCFVRAPDQRQAEKLSRRIEGAFIAVVREVLEIVDRTRQSEPPIFED